MISIASMILMKTRYAVLMICFLVLCNEARAQRLAVINAEADSLSDKYAAKMHSELSERLRVTDLSFSNSVFQNSEIEAKFNLTTSEAKQLGETIGCDFFLIVRVMNQPRNAFGQKFYHEATAALFLVSTRTGLMREWMLERFEEESSAAAEDALQNSVKQRSAYLAEKAVSLLAEELESEKKAPPAIYSPDEGENANGTRPPMPYRRISPEYTTLADLFAIKATVDAEVDIDENGEITNITIIRWAGYGLDDSVTAAIRKMNWRRGEQNGKPLAMRILLRYNFIKVDK